MFGEEADADEPAPRAAKLKSKIEEQKRRRAEFERLKAAHGVRRVT